MKKHEKNDCDTGEYAFDYDVYLVQLLDQLPQRRRVATQNGDGCAAPNPADRWYGPGPDRLF